MGSDRLLALILVALLIVCDCSRAPAPIPKGHKAAIQARPLASQSTGAQEGKIKGSQAEKIARATSVRVEGLNITKVRKEDYMNATQPDSRPRAIRAQAIPTSVQFIDEAGQEVERYIVGDTIYVMVVDQSQDRRPGVVDTIRRAVTVKNLATGQTIVVDVAQPGPAASFIFISGPITTGAPGEGRDLDVEHGQVLRVTYTDPDDPLDFASDEVRIEAKELLVNWDQSSNIPNPFSGTTTFKVSGEGILKIRILVFQLTGRMVFDSGEVAGSTLLWDGNDMEGHQLSSGVYLYIMQVIGKDNSESSSVKKLVILGCSVAKLQEEREQVSGAGHRLAP